MEKVYIAHSLHEARRMLRNLMEQSGKFFDGAFPFVGTLKKSYGFGKKIGMISYDKSIRFRIDYDRDKGVHFNYEDFSFGKETLKICIIVKGMSYAHYKRYIDRTNKGFQKHDYAKTKGKGRLKIEFPNRTVFYQSLFKKPHALYPNPNAVIKLGVEEKLTCFYKH